MILENQREADFHYVTITEGPMKGCHAFVLVPTNGFRFLDLPTEIRYIIYELSIPADSTKLRLALRENRNKKDPKVVGEYYSSRQTKAWRESRHWDCTVGNGKYVDLDQRTPMSLLLTNKQISSEAFEVLYRSHTFKFIYPAALSRFLKLNNASAKYLTNIQLSGTYTHGEHPIRKNVKKSSIEGALQVLAKARPASLRKLFVDHWDVSKGMYGDSTGYAEVLVAKCIPLLNAVYRARRQNGIGTGIDELIKIDHQFCRGFRGFDVYGHDGENRLWEEECEKFDQHVRKVVRDSFLMDVD